MECGDFADKTVSSSRYVDDEAISVLSVAQCTSQCADVDREVVRFDEDVRPNARHQLLLTDHFAGTLQQCDQNFQSAASDIHRLVAFQQKKLRGQQPKRAE